MSNYHQDNIRLQEAMTKDIDYLARVWDVSGSHVEIEEMEIPEKNVAVESTFVIKLTDKPYTVGVQMASQEELGIYMSTFAEFSTLEELQKTFPQLFELDGKLYAFS